jgi:hypothetical protein
LENASPANVAATKATNTISPSAAVEVPSTALKPSAIAIPSRTPMTSCTTRWRRWSGVVPIVIAAAIGAKNGCG